MILMPCSHLVFCASSSQSIQRFTPEQVAHARKFLVASSDSMCFPHISIIEVLTNDTSGWGDFGMRRTELIEEQKAIIARTQAYFEKISQWHPECEAIALKVYKRMTSSAYFRRCESKLLTSDRFAKQFEKIKKDVLLEVQSYVASLKRETDFSRQLGKRVAVDPADKAAILVLTLLDQRARQQARVWW